MSGREKEDGFKIRDRRLFTADGELRGDPPEEKTESSPAEARARQQDAASAEQPAPQTPPGPPTPEASLGSGPDAGPSMDEIGSSGAGAQAGVDFSSFLLSLATTAMVGLGEMADPASGLVAVNLDSAGQMINILGVLKKKTEGNLDPEEARLLEGLLYELRMKFVSRQGGASPQPGPPPGL